MKRLTRKGYAALVLLGVVWLNSWVFEGLGLGTAALIVMLSAGLGWELHKESSL